MDRGGAGSAALLRKRSLSVDTASAAAAAAGIDPFGSKQQAARDVCVAGVQEELVSPTGRLFREPRFRCHIVSVFGLGAPVDLPALRTGVAATLARHPRFCSVQSVVAKEEGRLGASCRVEEHWGIRWRSNALGWRKRVGCRWRSKSNGQGAKEHLGDC